MEKIKFDWSACVKQIQEGDAAAFEFLYNRTYNNIKKRVLFKTGFSEEDTEDIVQEIYIAVYRSIGSLKEPNAVISWMGHICDRTCIDALNKKIRRGEIADVRLESELAPENEEDEGFSLDQVISMEKSVETIIEEQEVRNILADILRTLKPLQRTCIELQLAGRSLKEIAALTGLPENTVKTHIFNAKKIIKARVQELERKGTKLYGLAPLPFFYLLFRLFMGRNTEMPVNAVSDAANIMRKAAEPVNAAGRMSVGNAGGSVSHGNISGTGATPANAAGSSAGRAPAAAGAAARSGAGAAAGSSAGAAGSAAGAAGLGIGKIIAIVIAAVVVIGGIIAATVALTRPAGSPGQSTTAVIMETGAAETAQNEPSPAETEAMEITSETTQATTPETTEETTAADTAEDAFAGYLEMLKEKEEDIRWIEETWAAPLPTLFTGEPGYIAYRENWYGKTVNFADITGDGIPEMFVMESGEAEEMGNNFTVYDINLNIYTIEGGEIIKIFENLSSTIEYAPYIHDTHGMDSIGYYITNNGRLAVTSTADTSERVKLYYAEYEYADSSLEVVEDSVISEEFYYYDENYQENENLDAEIEAVYAEIRSRIYEYVMGSPSSHIRTDNQLLGSTAFTYDEAITYLQIQ